MVKSVRVSTEKGNNSRPKLRKPSHDNGRLEILTCSQKDLRIEA